VSARGGSKSIPLKNLASLGGRPLLDYGVMAARASGCCDRIVCSTDHQAIERRASDLEIECDRRPPALATDEAAVADVASEWLHRAGMPEVVVLVQPTSPFVRPSDIRAVVEALLERPDAASAQTVTRCPHNHHAWNQREVIEGVARFRFAEERGKAINKQAKPELWLFGNVVAARPRAFSDPLGFFAPPSIAIPIERPYDLDIDDRADLALGNAILRAGAVSLEWDS
jgi:CMP-N-acetylneuraminic acid synthetase